MEESQAGYKEIDDALENRIRKPKEGISNDQYYKIQIDLLNTIKRRSLEEKLDPSEYETRLYKAFDVLSDLKSSLSQGYWEKTDPPHWSQDEQLIWFHRPAGHIGDIKISFLAFKSTFKIIMKDGKIYKYTLVR